MTISTGAGGRTVTCKDELPYNQWATVSFTWDSSNLYCYINGEYSGHTAAGGISDVSHNYFWGKSNAASTSVGVKIGAATTSTANRSATFIYNEYLMLVAAANAEITIDTPVNNTPTGSDNYSFSTNFNSTACGYWINGTYNHVGAVTEDNNNTGDFNLSSNGYYNATFICEHSALGNLTTTHFFTLSDTFYFRAYNNVSSVQLQNFTATFENATNTTAYTATGEWLNISRTGLPKGDINLTIALEGYQTTTFERNVNDTEIIYENYPINPAGFNIIAFDEETEERIYFTATITNSTGTTLTYNTVYNVTEYYLNSSFPTGVCTIDISTANSSHYDRRYYATIDNTSFYNLHAYLLNQSSDVILVRFHIRNKFGDPVEEASMNILKNIDGAEVTVAQGKSDAAGDITAYLLLNELYSLQVTHPDYANYYTSLYPSTNDYTISLGDASEDAYLPYNIYNDVSWLLIPYSNAITSEMTNITLFVTSANSSLYAWGMNVSWNGTSLYEVNVTGSPSGGVVYYNLNWTNATNYSTMGNISVQGWFKVNPPGGFSRDLQYISLGDADISLVSVQENLLVSGLSTLSFAIIWCLLALLGGAWVGRRSSIGGLVFMLAIMGIAAYGGWLDINTGSAVGGWFGVEDYTISGWYIFTFSALLALSVIYLKERWV